MNKHLPGRHSQQKHGGSSSSSVADVRDFVRNYFDTHSTAFGIPSFTVSTTPDNPTTHITVQYSDTNHVLYASNHVLNVGRTVPVPGIGSYTNVYTNPDKYEKVLEEAEDFGRAVKRRQVRTSLLAHSQLPGLMKRGYSISPIDLANARNELIANDDPHLESTFVNEFVNAYVKRLPEDRRADVQRGPIRNKAQSFIDEYKEHTVTLDKDVDLADLNTFEIYLLGKFVAESRQTTIECRKALT